MHGLLRSEGQIQVTSYYLSGMKRRLVLLLAVTISLLLLGTLAGYAYDRSRAEHIAEGVTVGGVDVGGLEAPQARARLRRQLTAPLRRKIVVSYGASSRPLSPASLGIQVDVGAAVEQALARSRDGNAISRMVRDIGGGELDVAVRPRVIFSSGGLRTFIQRLRHRFERPALNARVEATGRGLRRVAARTGRVIDRRRLMRLLSSALSQPRAPRRIVAPTRVITPEVTASELGERYPYFITVDRKRFRLHFFKKLRRVKSYVIAVGRVGLETPEGLYHIQNKAVDPAWSVPERPWAGALAGRVIPPGPDNPIKARWMGFYDGAGVHGTDDRASLGTAASHGCIRMSIPEVKELYRQVPVRTPIYVG